MKIVMIIIVITVTAAICVVFTMYQELYIKYFIWIKGINSTLTTMSTE